MSKLFIFCSRSDWLVKPYSGSSTSINELW